MTRLALLAAALFLMSCASNKPQTVSGTITGAKGEKLSLLAYTQGKPDTLHSVVLPEDGKFSFEVPAERLSFYTLVLNEQNKGIVLAFDSTQSPVVSADASTINTEYQVSGSKDSEALRQVQMQSYSYEKALDSLMQAMRNPETGDQERENLSKAYNDTRRAYKSYLIDHIESDSTSIANFTILQKLNTQEDLKYFLMVRNGLRERMQGSFFYDQMADKLASLEAQAKSAQALSEGAVAPDIVLPNPEGKEVALSSLRGNYVLIDFWASWCKPCRMENPRVVELYEKYSGDNFEIFGVSLDRDAEKWKEAIAADGLKWTQVSDLQFWNSAAAKLYNVRSIPYTVLLNPEGEIIATKLRGAALESKLAEIFGH